MRARLLVAAWILVLAEGCGDPPTPVVPDAGPPMDREGCNPFASAPDCMLPFPSDHFLVDDDTLPSGHRVALPPTAWPTFRDAPFDFFGQRAIDGFSPATPIVVHFPVALDVAPLVRWDEDIGATQRGEGPTVIVDAATGERVPHFAELDASADDPTQAALVLRPLVRLSPETRYVVGLRGLVDVDGAAAPIPPAFQRLRDAEATEPSLARYDAEIFPVLAAAGFARTELQLAWDFTTASEARLTGDLVEARRIAMDALEGAAPAVRVTSVQEGALVPERLRATVARLIELEIDAPSILESATAGEGRLRRDASGTVVSEGIVTFPVTIMVPHSVADRAPGAAPARLLQYGHGFFGTRGELTNGYLDEFANEHGFVGVAADWWGMMIEDRDALVNALGSGEPAGMFAFVERTHQGMVNFVVLAGAAATIASLPELAGSDGAPLFDPSEVYFWGNSQGHILGGVYTAISPHVTHAVLGVGGANFSLIMFRSRAFTALRFLLELHVEGPVAMQGFTVLLQHWLDRIDPLHYARYVLEAPLEGARPKQVLLHTAPGDDAVTPLAAELHARALGIPLLVPSAFLPPLLETAMAPVPSALVELDYGIDGVPVALPPEGGNEIHEAVRRNPRVHAQVDAFFHADGVVTQTCDGACDPE